MKIEHNIERLVDSVIAGIEAALGCKLAAKRSLLMVPLQLAATPLYEKNTPERAIHDLIVSYAATAEKLAPGSFVGVISSLRERHLTCGEETNPRLLTNDGVCPQDQQAAVPTASDIDWLVDNVFLNDHDSLKTMIKAAVELAGFAGRIVIERSERTRGVELIRGHSFEHDGSWTVPVKLTRPRAVCVDGFVESVSELNRLLTDASETKEPVVLFVRGLAAEVQQTLRVNFDRGTLRVVPVIMPFDIQGINTMIDVSVVTGADMVSSNKGDLISAIRLEHAPHITEAIITAKKATITNPSTHQRVSEHLQSLRKRRDEQKVEDVSKLLDERIKSMSPNHVVVRLQDDDRFLMSSMQVDVFLRSVKALVDHGTIVLDGRKRLALEALVTTTYSKRLKSALADCGVVVTA